MKYYLIITVVLFVTELLYFKIAEKFNIIDKPNERSSHTQITLRGGGVIFYIGAIIYFFISDFQYPYFFIGLTFMVFISFLDDIYTLSSKVRILIHFISVFLLCYQVEIFSQPFYWTIPVIIIIIGTINAYNFMDGINGITASYSVAVLGLLLIVNHQKKFVENELIIITIISTMVFAFFNFRKKARCFAGDVGSVGIAFIILFLLAKLIINTQNLFYILFLLVYGLDTGWTIIRRIIKKENIFEAHRSHLYQYMSNEGKINKLLISFLYGIIQFIIGLFIIYFAEEHLKIRLGIFLAILAIGSVIYYSIKNYFIKKYNL